MAPNLLKKAGQAVALNAIANWTTMIGSFMSMIIIARILTPADYGIFVMALVALSLPEIVATGTLGDALIQRKELRPGHINSVFLQSMALAVAFWLILIILAPYIAQGFSNPAVTPVLIVCGVMLPIGAANSVPAALLQRDLCYKEITYVDVMGTVVAAIVGIVLALLWRNEWALVGMELARRTVRLIGFMVFAKWVPTTKSSWEDLRDLARFNSTNGASRILQMFDSLLPKTLIGVALGSAPVGIFNLAERLFTQARQALIDPFASIALPVASILQDDRSALHRAMENATRTSALLAYPTFIGGFVVAPLLIPAVFGDHWVECVPIFQIFMVIGLRAPMTAIISGVLRGIGRPDAVIRLTIVSLASTIILLAVTYKYGLFAISIGLLIRQLITFVVSTWQIQNIVGFSILRQLKAGSTAFFAASIMGMCVWLLMVFLPPGPDELIRLVSIILAGALIYPLALFGFEPRLGLSIVRAAPVFLAGQPRQAINLVRSAITK